MLDGLLINQIRADPEIAGMLALYNNKPAFFYQKAPTDSDRDWNCSNKYPRIDYNINMNYSPEHNTAGTLTLNVWCNSLCLFMPEDIEKRLIALINGSFYSKTNQNIVCAVWKSSQAFNFDNNFVQNKSTTDIFGVSITFELLEFPTQIITDPDPIHGLYKWTKFNFPDLAVIARDSFPEIWKPNDSKPAIYWRFISSQNDASNNTYAVTRFNANFAAHLITDTVTERNKWLKALAEKLQADGEIILPDGSPMFIKHLQINHSANPLLEGQLTFSGQYGILAQQRNEQAQVPLYNANFNHPLNTLTFDKLKTTDNRTDVNLLVQNEKKYIENSGVYSITELTAQSKTIFGVPPEFAAAALKSAGINKCSLNEAIKTVTAFLKKEII